MNHRIRTCAGVLLLASAVIGAQAPDRFAQWMAAVAAHEPGNPSKSAVDIAVWTGVELDTVIAEAKQYARSLPDSRIDEANDLLLRGAALHADIAKLIPDEIVRRSPRQEAIFIVRDGREQGKRFVSIHWELGRSLLDAVTPDPAAHPGVRQWYRDTSMDLIRIRALTEAAVQLPIARRMFPADPVVLYASGLLHERFASPPLQTAADAIMVDSRGAAAVDSARAELTRAERFFRDLLVVQPDHLDARVRHGRVLGQLGRHGPGADELRHAIANGASGALLYLAELFLGREEEALGDNDLARSAFEKAAALYPRAQSPHLALSHLSRRAGDHGRAQRELAVLGQLPRDELQRSDPWWTYYEIR